jgi:serine/threonine-protein kinase
MKPKRWLAGALLTIVATGCAGEHPAQPSRRPVKLANRSGLLVNSRPSDRNVYVPDVSGQPLDRAKAALKVAGLPVRVVKRSSDSVPSGRAIGTSPAVSTFVKQGTPVELLESSGPQIVKLPNVLGRSQTDAEHQLAAVGLVVVIVDRPGSARVGTVVLQSPAAGASVRRGSTAQITVSTAPPSVLVPNFVKQTEEAAVTAASKLGLLVTFKTRVVHALALDRVVLAQSPLPGLRLLKGFKVTLTVARYEPPSHAGARQ